MLRQLVRKGLNAVDDLVVAADPRAEDHHSLVNVLFHSLYESSAQLGDPALAPNQNVTVADFSAFIEEMLENNYKVVSPAQVDAGLKPGGRYLTITFDDGYFNNQLALEVLNRFRVPATFFISTDHVHQNKAFWWDAFSRELSRSGVPATAQKAEIEQLKVWTPERIDAFLCQRFGSSVLKPSGDLDRPFTPRELGQFALNPWVHIGNHTRDHAILTNCTPDEMAEQIRACQDALADLVGYRPVVIAYPNGNCSPAAVQAALAAGLRLGFTVAPQAPRLPLDDASRMTMGRFFFFGGQDIRRQCRLFGARLVPSHALKRLMQSSPY
ncbi:MAG: Polysaccharide deacetylase [Polaromonas sp.]|nr:Polysaccharide deacetylase [Polaromonas sp.]